ncbi:MAG: shikimate dehydrogenase [Proteobacteria bacterium]|nr:shikimate dehydrogenase [Pseudomonadota bacterium]
MSQPPDSYGVVGHPVAHSLSPFIHAMFARATAQQLTYRAWDVAPPELLQRVAEFFAGGGRGLNITLPHKIAAVDLAQQLTERAAHAAAVNTLAAQDGVILGDNTDGAGLVRDLCHNQGLTLAGSRILILGAGGATRGILAPLLELQPQGIVIANRTAERAQSLAAAFADLGTVGGTGFGQFDAQPFDLIINATSASLSGEMPPLPAAALTPDTVCYDLAYGKGDTPFVVWARQRGCRRALSGLGMLVEQAAESFELWRGVRPATAEVLAALRARQG